MYPNSKHIFPMNSLYFSLIMLLACFNVTAQEEQSCTVREEGEYIYINNSYFTLTLQPNKGGQIRSFLFQGYEFVPTDSDEGMLMDLLYEEIHEREFLKKKYAFEILSSDPKEVRVHLWSKGERGLRQFIEYHKTIIVRKDQCGIQVDYEVRNLPHSMQTITLSPWSHNLIAMDKDEGFFYLPTAKGIRQENPKNSGDVWVKDAVRAWSAYIGKNQIGVVGISDYRYLKNLYNWYGTDKATLEWMYGPVKIEAGQSFKTTYWFVPFQGLSAVQEATSDTVISVIPSTNSVSSTVFSSSLQDTVEIALQVRRLPDTTWDTLITEHRLLVPGKSVTIQSPWKTKQNGTYVFRCILKDQSRQTVTAEAPFVAGANSGIYSLTATEGKLFKEEPDYVPFVPSQAITTPHIKWGTPYALGKTNALFITSARQLREVMELAQRMDLDYTTASIAFNRFEVSWYHANTLMSNGFKEVEQLLDPEYDFILLSGSAMHLSRYEHKIGLEVLWDSLTEKTRQKLLDKVKNGTGLVYAYPRNVSGEIEELFKASTPVTKGHFIINGVPQFPKDPTLKKRLEWEQIRTVQYGKGRIVFVDFPMQCLTPFYYQMPEIDYYDYALSFIAKSVLWVSHKEPHVCFETVSQNQNTITGVIRNIDTNINKAVLVCSIHDLHGHEETTLENTIEIMRDESAFTFSIPSLKGGIYNANLFLKQMDGRILNWFTCNVTVDRESKIQSVSLEKNILSPNETLKASIKVSANTISKDNLSLAFCWIDNEKRIIWQKGNIPLSEMQNENDNLYSMIVDIPLHTSITRYNELVTSLFQNNNKIDEQQSIFLIPRRNWDDYRVILWHMRDWLPEHLATQQERRLREMGADTLDLNAGYCPTFTQSASMMKADMTLSFVGLNRFNLNEKDFAQAEKTLMRPRCFSDPEYRKSLYERLQKRVREESKYNPLFYSIGDENSLTSYSRPLDICRSIHCLSKFRSYLQSQYKNLASLNAHWKMNFATWDAVMPMSAIEAQKRELLNFAPWADHRTFMDNVYVNALQFCKNTIKEIDQQGLVGECGTEKQSTYGGLDWSKKMNVWDVLQPYGKLGNQLDIQRSFSSVPLAAWAGYGDTSVMTENRLWWGLFHGEHGVSLWYTPVFLLPDFRFSQTGEAIRDLVANELKKGVGKLLIHAKRARGQIAVHYSQASVQAAYILKTKLGYDTEEEYYANQDGWLRVLEDLGVQYDFVACEQIETGTLQHRGYQCLILPLSRAISKNEADYISTFVESGGHVIADCQAGLFDEHLVLHPRPVLDSLFGIERQNNTWQMEKSSRILRYKSHTSPIASFELLTAGDASEKGDLQFPEVQLGNMILKNKTANELPAFISHKIKSGRASYLNMLLDYSNKRKVFRESAISNLMSDFLHEHNIRANCKILRQDSGEAVPYTESVIFEAENVRLLGILKDPEMLKGVDYATATAEIMNTAAVNAKIVLPNSAFVYNVRQHQYYGNTNQINIRLIPGKAILLALLPREIDRLKIDIPTTRYHAGETVQGTVMFPSTFHDIVRLECHNPNGDILPYFSKNLLLHKGKASFSLPLALNEKPGAYQIRCVDVIAGKQSNVQFLLTAE